jgi:hypothetical protein
MILPLHWLRDGPTEIFDNAPNLPMLPLRLLLTGQCVDANRRFITRPT